MSAAAETLAGLALVSLALLFADVSHAQDRESRLERQMAASAAHQAREAERVRVARQRWESERRRSAAHARMPDTMYASTPSAPAAELSCPVVTDDDMRRAVQGWGDEVSSSPYFSEDLLAARDDGVFRAPPLQGMVGGSGSRGDDASAESAPHDAWSATVATASNVADTTHLVPLFPSASDAALQGFVRVINHSGDSGEVQIEAIDDTGVSYGPLTLSIDAAETVHFNSNDLEGGNTGKGLTGSTGAGEGDWRLTLTSDLDVEVLSYIRTTDGFLTAMHDLAPEAEGEHRIAIFNPGSNAAQVSRLRLINPGEAEAQVTIEGVDDRGMSPGGTVEVTVAAGVTQTLTAAELESGGTGMTGALGDGAGKWQLTVRSDAAIHALSLLSSPTGHLTNLSTAPSNLMDGVYEVALFPSASDASGRQGFVRVINRSESTAEITIRAHDETDWTYEPLTLSLQGGQVAHFNSNDLEQGNVGKGLTGSTGAGEGDWRLELSSDADIEVLSYIRTTDGFLTAMHDVAPVSGTRHRVVIFNPGSNTAQVSRLRLVNTGEEAAAVTIVGTDDQGLSPGGDVLVTVPAGGTRTHTAQELEEGAEGLEGSLGDGAGKWRLEATSDVPIRVLSLLSSPTGHLTNLSTATARGSGMETAAEVFRTLISGPIVQSKCVNCHVEEGVSGNTRLVFVTDAAADHMATNLKVFEDFLAEVEDGASYILNKIQGALGHGGGIQVASGTEEFSNMERFLGLLEGEEVAPVTITPASLFDGVKMESWRSTLRRAAIMFAGRIPTKEEYESIETGGPTTLRATIRGLMEGLEFHEYLIRASNDRLLTDREGGDLFDNYRFFVDHINKLYELNEKAVSSEDEDAARYWEIATGYGANRAPLELIAYVVENDLPYTEVLTADYVMANPWSAEVYGSSAKFSTPKNAHEFKPSTIERYFRHGPGYEWESTEFGNRVINPGTLVTSWPHAGILNTKAFLQRYPTTPTNRNRARSRWTYYHFLGIDIEKSASRTTDPVALADTNNPTLNNAACTVCHSVLDPIAGAFQNYGNEGFYRDQWRGKDALDDFYKEPQNEAYAIEALSWMDRETISLRLSLTRKDRLFLTMEGVDWGTIYVDRLTVRGVTDSSVTYSLELEDADSGIECPAADEFGCGGVGHNEETGEQDHWRIWGPFYMPLQIPGDGVYDIDLVVWTDQPEGLLRLGTTPYRIGDTWYRGMRSPGHDGELTPEADHSLQWVAEKVVANDRFSEATVEFWWPSIMGSKVAQAPEDEKDARFQGRLLASSAQNAEVERLARGFRQGFSGRASYNLKDLLVEMVFSDWFRAASSSADDSTRASALRDAGANRLLTPEELARKTGALTGFQWGRGTDIQWWQGPHTERYSALTDENRYRLMYGGIDSGGITGRVRDITSIMAAIAESHAMESSCPIVLREFYLLPEARKRLFAGVDENTTPVLEFGTTFEVEAASWFDRETLSVRGPLTQAAKTASLAFRNEGDERMLRLDKLVIRDSESGVPVYTVELEELSGQASSGLECGTDLFNEETRENDHWALWHECNVPVPISVPADAMYDVEVVAWADQSGDKFAKLTIALESDTESSVGSEAIRQKLVELHETLLGVEVDGQSPDIQLAYELFLDVWGRKQQSPDIGFFEYHCDFWDDFEYFEGVLAGAILEEEGWDYDRVRELLDSTDTRDLRGVARTWVVVLAYLLMDYRYLYL